MWIPLKRQIGIIGLLLLLLPAFGLLSLRLVEVRLSDYQATTLSQRLEALGTLLSSQTSLISERSDSIAINPFAIQREMRTDGYLDDWAMVPRRGINLHSRPELNNGTTRAQVSAVETNQHLWLLIDIQGHEPQRLYQSGRFVAGDQLAITTEFGQYAITPSLGNDIIARERDQSVNQRVSGYWKPLNTGSILELRIPKDLVGSQLGIALHIIETSSGSIVLRNFDDNEVTPSIVWTDATAQQLLRQYHALDKQAEIRLTDDNLNLLAWSGNSSDMVTPEPLNWLQRLSLVTAQRSNEKHINLSSSWQLEELIQHSSLQRDAPAITHVNAAAWPSGALAGVIRLDCGVANCATLTIIEPKVMGKVLWSAGHLQLIFLLFIGAIIIIILISFWARWLAKRLKKLENRMTGFGPQGKSRQGLDEISVLANVFDDLQQQIVANTEYLEQLGSRLSHELKTPLTVIQSSLEHLRRHATEDSGTYIERAAQGSQQLQVIFQRLTEARNLEQLLRDVKPEAVNVNHLVHQIVEGYRIVNPTLNIEFIASAAPRFISTDGDFLAQALTKLIDNAISFHTPGTHILVSVIDDKDSVSMTITNEGPLLAEPTQQLFEAFVSLRSQESSNHLGFGLYLSKLICEHFAHQLFAENIHPNRVSFTIKAQRS
ncbi:ATP-binding protein [uncultured Umboniibacter sp.]|uniref:ATP-binding protein n=1 Tax=uncultured Umboniibacter sp. TaxID=1798917 RepID=UPI00260A2227|nr:ATP-binding protein [uncultured Umboniibacter sp.]